ncbi:MAG: hypothetical protein MI724_05580 [Spirochaetales bacterium]|nr:hypothetical protein [Spirochaetales bacterium]
MDPSNTPAVVCDAGPLIHLDELDCADLLSDFSHCIVAPAVWEEVSRHRPAVLARTDIPFSRPEVVPSPTPTVQALLHAFDLHPGEREALVLAATDPATLFLTDDTAARVAASSLGITVHGSLGVLIRSVRRGLRSTEQVLATLRAIPHRSTLHIRATLLDEVIATVAAQG